MFGDDEHVAGIEFHASNGKMTYFGSNAHNKQMYDYIDYIFSDGNRLVGAFGNVLMTSTGPQLRSLGFYRNHCSFDDLY